MKRLSIMFLPLLVCLISFIQPNAARSDPAGMFELYENNRKEKIPNYITEDFILLSHGMIVGDIITRIEEKYLYPRFSEIVAGLIQTIESGEPRDEIAKANLDYLGVIEALLSETGSPARGAGPGPAAEEINAVMNARGVSVSKLMRQRIDYSQFKVRGKYTKSEALSRYFRAMRYAGAVLFPVLESNGAGISTRQADQLTLQALALVETIYDNTDLLNNYQSFIENLSWLFGPPDDLGIEDYKKTRDHSPDAEIAALRQALLAHAKKEGKQPLIIGGIVDVAALKKEKRSKADVMTGFRFMPPRFTPDGAAFQQLVFDRVGKWEGEPESEKPPFSNTVINSENVKGFPLGLELMALLGSEEAKKRLKASGDQAYEGYEEAFRDAARILDRSEGMTTRRLDFMRYCLTRGAQSRPKEKDAGRLNTVLGFWTYNRYIGQLYTKQSYTAVAKGFVLPGRDAAWLEPVPGFYLQLKALANDLRARLETFSKKEKEMATALKKIDYFIRILDKCHDIAKREMEKKPPRKADIHFLNGLDKELSALTGGPDTPVVVDVHTDPASKKVLEEALGHPRVVTREMGDGKDKARGALFRYYEFKYNMEDRLTDAKWRRILDSPGKMERLEFSPGSTRTSRNRGPDEPEP